MHTQCTARLDGHCKKQDVSPDDICVTDDEKRTTTAQARRPLIIGREASLKRLPLIIGREASLKRHTLCVGAKALVRLIRPREEKPESENLRLEQPKMLTTSPFHKNPRH